MYSQNARRRAHTRSPRRVVARVAAGAAAVARVSRESSRTHGPVARRFETKSHTRTTTSRAIATRVRSFVARDAHSRARAARDADDARVRRRRVDRSRASRDADDVGAVPVRRPRRRGKDAPSRDARRDDAREATGRRDDAREARDDARGRGDAGERRSGRTCAWRTCWRARGRRKRR